MLVDIDWDKFKVVNKDYHQAFEQLCFYLFCRRYNQSAIFRYKNQIGIETDPIAVGREEVGFQSKWFEAQINDSKIIASLRKGKDRNPGLNRVLLFVNQEFSERKKGSPKEDRKKHKIEEEAKKLGIAIEWIVPSIFQSLLIEPKNLDLAQLFFDFSDEFGFITNSIDPQKITFLQSTEYIDLPIEEKTKSKTINDVSTEILSLRNSTILISGNPGSGKSVSMHQLFRVYSGLDKKTIKNTRTVLTKNKAIPMLINLKNCATVALEEIVRGRQNDFRLRKKNYEFIYLLDGLDELSPDKVDNLLTSIAELEKSSETRKIIISCRTGNLNRIKLLSYIQEISEYTIGDLSVRHIEQYFEGRGQVEKIRLLKSLKRKSPSLLDEVKDILLVSLLWDTIAELGIDATILDLLSKKIFLLVNDPKYKKNINELNLLDPKEDKLIELNQDISYIFQNKYQFRISQQKVQKLILKKFERLDYKSTNSIFEYIAALFFGRPDPSPAPTNSRDMTYVYLHRRYQDFFFIQRLEKEFEKEPKILRSLNILSNRDFFNNLFLNYLRTKKVRERDLAGILELNLFDVYLGKRNDYGADDPYYRNSTHFLPSLAMQPAAAYEELMADENLLLKNKLLVDIADLSDQFKQWNKKKNEWRVTQNLKDIWSYGVGDLLSNISVFWKQGKMELANELRNNLQRTVDMYNRYNFIKKIAHDNQPNDPFWDHWEDWIYFLMVIKRVPPQQIFADEVRRYYASFSQKDNLSFREEGKEKLAKSFFRVCIVNDSNALVGLIDGLNDEEFRYLAEVISSVDALPYFFENTGLVKTIKKKSAGAQVTSSHIAFIKQLVGITPTKAEQDEASAELKKLREQRGVEWRMYNIPHKAAVVSHVCGENSFDKFLASIKSPYSFRYYDELGLYTALFKGFVEILLKQTTVFEVLRDFSIFANHYDEVLNGKYLVKDISELWGNILALSKISPDRVIAIKQKLLSPEHGINQVDFYYKLLEKNPTLYQRIVNVRELENFENTLHEWEDDLPSYVDYCFVLSALYSRVEEPKAITLFSRGINEGILRHGWRKDVIVSYLLVDALRILWRNNWASREELRAMSKSVYQMEKRVNQITDGDETWQGRYNLIDLVSEFDVELAIEFKDDLKKDDHRDVLINRAQTSILLGKVARGFSLEEIEEGMNEYRAGYRYDDKRNPDEYEQRFRVYVTIALSYLYSDEERKLCFENAYKQVEEIKRQKIDYYLRDNDYDKDKKSFVELCNQYGKTVNVSFDTDNSRFEKKAKKTEEQFSELVRRAKTKSQLSSLYRQLGNYENGIVLKKNETWKLLVEKTRSLFANIQPFIRLLSKNAFPHHEYYTANSKYFHFGLAAALGSIETRAEAEDFLLGKTTGHGGFLNLMKSYEVLGEKDKCLVIFKRFVRVCDFLVY